MSLRKQGVLQSTELQAELEKVKTSYRIGRILYLMRARQDITQALMLTSPPGGDAKAHAGGGGAAAVSSAGGRAARLMAKTQAQAGGGLKIPEGPEAALAKPGRARGKVDKITQVMSIAKKFDSSGDGGSGSTMKGGQAAVGKSSMIEGAGQSTGFLKLEAQRIEAIIQRIRTQQMALTAGILTGNSCGCLHPMHPLRTRCAAIIIHQDFQTAINIVIVASCAAMLAERPRIPKTQQDVLDVTNLAFSIVFIAEAILKIIALGFGVYLRSAWNKLDFFIVVSSVVDIIITYAVPESGAAEIVRVAKIMRVFRAVRPLGAVLRSEGLVVVLRAVTESIVPLLATVVISILVVSVFAIIGQLNSAVYVCVRARSLSSNDGG